MEFDRWISSQSIRVATLGGSALFAAVTYFYFENRSSELLLACVIATGVPTALGVILSFRPIYAVWMRIAEILQRFVSTVLFGSCYLLLVPLMLLAARLGGLFGRRREFGESLWVRRAPRDTDPRSYQRMG